MRTLAYLAAALVLSTLALAALLAAARLGAHTDQEDQQP